MHRLGVRAPWDAARSRSALRGRSDEVRGGLDPTCRSYAHEPRRWRVANSEQSSRDQPPHPLAPALGGSTHRSSYPLCLHWIRHARKILFRNSKLNVDTCRSVGVQDGLSCWRGIESWFIFLNRMFEWVTLSGIAPAAPSQTHLLVPGAAEAMWKTS